MSFSSEPTVVSLKKRRIQRACDVCRKRKIKCENSGKPDEACIQCKMNKSPCTYSDFSKSVAPSKMYVKWLEDRLGGMEKTLHLLCTDDTVLRKFQDAQSSDDDADDSSNILIVPAPVQADLHNPSTILRDILTNPLDDIFTLIHSKVIESSSTIKDSVTTSIRRASQHAPLANNRTEYHTPVNQNRYRDTVDEIDKWVSLEDVDRACTVAQSLKSMYVQPPEYRFFGESSEKTLVDIAMEIKLQAHLQAGNKDPSPPSVGGQGAHPMMTHLRPEFWTPQPWELSILPRPRSMIFPTSSLLPSHSQTPLTPLSYAVFHFPPADLAPSLISNYFLYINLHYPLLHRETFDHLVAEHGFIQGWKEWRGGSTDAEGCAQVYLLVCALGAWYSEDARCLLDEEHDSEREPSFDEGERKGIPGSAGWKWFKQVQLTRNRSLFTPPTLEDLQVYALSAQFLRACSAPQSSWTIVGIGIRLAQDVGIHRRNSPLTSQVPTRDGELWKRAFWVLVSLDRLISCHLGRSCALQDEDFDLDLPIDCDDEFWEADNPDPAMRFRQPSTGKPSLVTSFLLYIELTHILACLLRTIYPINKSTALCVLVGPEWEQAVVSELDSALNKWADSIPGHLKWDPYRENDLLFNQSASLWATYYLVRILVHRPFIPSQRKRPSMTMPSLAICTNAARTCCSILDAQHKRTGTIIPQVQMTVFQCAVVLLLSIWGAKRSGLLIDARREMEDVHKCMNMLKIAEQRWNILGRVYDVIHELASVQGNLSLPLPQPEARTRNKRAQNVQGGQAEFETDRSTLTGPNFSESRRAFDASRPLVNGSSHRNQLWDGVDVADPTSSFTQTTPPMYSGEPFRSGIPSNGLNPALQQGQFTSSLREVPCALGIPEYSAANTAIGSATQNHTLAEHQHLNTGLSDADLIDVWINTLSGFQFDIWGTYLSTPSTNPITQ